MLFWEFHLCLVDSDLFAFRPHGAVRQRPSTNIFELDQSLAVFPVRLSLEHNVAKR
jgi:hypothetical protein